jgi:hypothetical protein
MGIFGRCLSFDHALTHFARTGIRICDDCGAVFLRASAHNVLPIVRCTWNSWRQEKGQLARWWHFSVNLLWLINGVSFYALPATSHLAAKPRLARIPIPLDLRLERRHAPALRVQLL